ncbi:MAG: hypothetical protein ACREUT_05540 [Steroidobacteraceae bacterium]
MVSPCILPVLPLVFARSDRPFVSNGLPSATGEQRRQAPGIGSSVLLGVATGRLWAPWARSPPSTSHSLANAGPRFNSAPAALQGLRGKWY